MKLRPSPAVLLLLPALLWQCATPASRPAVPQGSPRTPAETSGRTDDDHRLVPAEEFLSSSWRPLGPGTSWREVPGGAAVTLADGRELVLTIPSAGVVRWWIPAANDSAPRSPGARYDQAEPVAVRVAEEGGQLRLSTPALTAELRLDTLALRLASGSQSLLSALSGPRQSGRRLSVGFDASSAPGWAGPGLPSGRGAAHHWPGASESPWTAPTVGSVGQSRQLILTVDTGYQAYTAVTDATVTLGSLNGGLDLLIATSGTPWAALANLTALTGRPPVLPTEALGTALVLPAGETGTFVRQARLSLGTASGGGPAAGFSLLTDAGRPGPLPDLTLADQRRRWASLPAAGGVRLPPVPRGPDWEQTYDDGAHPAPWAAVASRLPGLEALAYRERWPAQTRPWLLAGSGGPGLVRQALPEVVVNRSDNLDQRVAELLDLGVSGWGTPAVRLVRPTPGQLASLLLAPALTIDWGAGPEAAWESFSDADRKAFKSLLDRRSEFLPLLAELNRETARTGRPSWEPLWWAAPNDPKTREAEGEYLVGSGLLTALQPASGDHRSVYLPGPGVWFDYWTGEELGGGRSYDREVRPDRPLLFARGGALVPTREAEAFDGKAVYNPLTFHVFPGGRGTGTYWADDGRTTEWKTGAYWETKLTYESGPKTMTLDHQTLNTSPRVKADPYILYRLHNLYKPKQVKIDGRAIPLFGDSWGITNSDRSAAWYESDHSLLIKTFRPERDQGIEMTF